MLVYSADRLTCVVPYDADANAIRVPIRGMRTHSCPATSLVYPTVFTHNKVAANVEPSVDVHVVVLVRTDYGSTRVPCRAVWDGAPWCITTLGTGLASVAAVPVGCLPPHPALLIILGHSVE
jgi:hypothetical protein